MGVFLPVYRHLVNSTADIDFLWGGRDSGKSTFVAEVLLIECMTLPYFRCILIKKTHESIKDAQWQTLKDIAERWGVAHLFSFSKSPLEIRCRNGNKFISRGCDKPEKIKSINNPSHVWYEEGNQLSADDMIVISTTLRSNQGKVKQYFSFNPEADGDYTKHWLWLYFKDHIPTGVYSFENVLRVPDGKGGTLNISYTSTHSTYHNNPYCTNERKAVLENLRTIDEYYYEVFTLGRWGNRSNERPFVFAYEPSKHNGTPALNNEEVLYLSFDFNRNPICCSVIQHYDGAVYVLRTIKIANSSIYELCDRIKTLYPRSLFMVTGDATGRASSALVQDNMNYYKVIMQSLGLGMMQLRVPKANPRMKDNRLIVNAVLANYPVTVHEVDAHELLADFKQVRCNPDGTIEKGNRDDPAQQADALDTFRYWCNAIMLPYINLAT
jgi:phage terminase large subunit